jgi:hypothetical protein
LAPADAISDWPASSMVKQPDLSVLSRVETKMNLHPAPRSPASPIRPAFSPRRAWAGASLGLSLGLFLGLGCATPPLVVAPGLALRKVVIYRNGVGYFERGGHVQSDRVQFQVRKDEVGDFLATLAVLERGGSSVRAASFPLDVERDTPPSPASGDDKGAAAKETLRQVIMSLDGKEHDLQVGYIAQTPVWRPSYRLVIDKESASLQAWGVVQNLSGVRRLAGHAGDSDAADRHRRR